MSKIKKLSAVIAEKSYVNEESDGLVRQILFG